MDTPNHLGALGAHGHLKSVVQAAASPICFSCRRPPICRRRTVLNLRWGHADLTVRHGSGSEEAICLARRSP